MESQTKELLLLVHDLVMENHDVAFPDLVAEFFKNHGPGVRDTMEDNGGFAAAIADVLVKKLVMMRTRARLLDILIDLDTYPESIKLTDNPELFQVLYERGIIEIRKNEAYFQRLAIPSETSDSLDDFLEHNRDLIYKKPGAPRGIGLYVGHIYDRDFLVLAYSLSHVAELLGISDEDQVDMVVENLYNISGDTPMVLQDGYIGG